MKFGGNLEKIYGNFGTILEKFKKIIEETLNDIGRIYEKIFQ